VVFRFTRKAVQEINPALLIPLFVVFYLFIFGTWLSTGIANLMILRDRSARHSPAHRLRRAQTAATGFLIGGKNRSRRHLPHGAGVSPNTVGLKP